MFGIFKRYEENIQQLEREYIENFVDAKSLLAYFKEETGIDFVKKEEIITVKLANFCKKRGFYNFESFLDNIKVDSFLKQELVDYLTVNETYFYREFQQIEKLVQKVKKSSKINRILCIPSSTGEEPYTIAIALLEEGISRDKFEIIGVDINSEVITLALKAVYRSRSLHRVPSNIKERYFTKEGESYALSNRVKELVSFKIINLFDDTFDELGMFDYIFCRNMMIYFDKTTKLKAKSILEMHLKDSKSEIFFGHADVV